VIDVSRMCQAALVASALLAVPVQAQTPEVIDTSKIGPQVGATVPPVSGVDQFGKTQSLESLSGPKGLMLVFNRSADW